MKIFRIITMIFLLIISANKVATYTYWSGNIDAWISSKTSSIQLLINYANEYQIQINALFTKYEIDNKDIISAFNNNISNINTTLKNTENENVSSVEKNEVISKSINSLKNLNNKMKIYLDQEKILFEKRIQKTQRIYSNIWERVSPVLDDIIQSITNLLSKKKTLSENDKKIVKSLVVLRSENIKIKNFSNIKFWSEDQMKDYFKEIIISIRSEILLIKSTTR